MSEVNIDEAKILKSAKMALLSTVQLATEEISKITPRDKNRLPKDPERRVTGNLKRSIKYEEKNEFSYIIGSTQGEDAYAGIHEFGGVIEIPRKKKGVVIGTYVVYIPPRSYLRKGLEDNNEKLIRYFKKIVNSLIGR